MTIILGIDPGLLHTGWGLIETEGNRLHYIACGTISPDHRIGLTMRLHVIHQELHQVITQFRPDECAIEETFVNSNAATSLKLGQARGAILLTLAIAGLHPDEYAPTLIKKSVVGVGRAEKHQIQKMVRLLLPGCDVENADAADSLAIAICHNSHRVRKG